MLGRFTNSKKPIVIVGGGFAGLVLAWRLTSLGREVELFEESSQFGGMLVTKKLTYGLSEQAANSLLVNEAVKNLTDSLKVELVKLDKSAKARYIVRNGKLRRFPLNFIETLNLLYRITTIKSKGCYETVADWAEDFLGDSALKFLVDPALTGIYAAKPEILSLPAVFPTLQIPSGKTLLRHLLGRKRSSQNPSFMAIPEGGMQTLVDSLIAWLRSSGKAQLYLNKGREKLPTADNLAVCLPAYRAAVLLESECSTSAKILKDIVYSPLTSITLVVKNEFFKTVPLGTGCLFPACEEHKVLGVLFCSSSFKSVTFNPDYSVLRVMVGGVRDPETIKLGSQELLERAFCELNQLFKFKLTIKELINIALTPSDSRVEADITHWPKAIPIYSPQMWRSLQDIKWTKGLGSILFSNYTGKVSLRGMVEQVLKVN
jgi:protoporphyrinogen/coproporphyrinogen III oxidase